jgi:hypothetical protein
VANYLYTTAHLELVYNTRDPAQRSAVVQLFAYSDAAFLTHADSKSHSGIHFTLGEGTGVFHARSQKQKMVTLSSTEAEVYAAIECTKDIILFREILKELGHPQKEPTTLYMDNKSAIILGQDMTGEHKKARHFMARLRFLIEQVKNSVIKLEHMGGTTLPADEASPRPRSQHRRLNGSSASWGHGSCSKHPGLQSVEQISLFSLSILNSSRCSAARHSLHVIAITSNLISEQFYFSLS